MHDCFLLTWIDESMLLMTFFIFFYYLVLSNVFNAAAVVAKIGAINQTIKSDKNISKNHVRVSVIFHSLSLEYCILLISEYLSLLIYNPPIQILHKKNG